MRDSSPQTLQRKHDKIADAQLPPSCIFADSRCLLDRATQMDCGTELLALWTSIARACLDNIGVLAPWASFCSMKKLRSSTFNK